MIPKIIPPKVTPMVGRMPPVFGNLIVGTGVVVAFFVVGTAGLEVGGTVGSSSPTPTEPRAGVAAGGDVGTVVGRLVGSITRVLVGEEVGGLAGAVAIRVAGFLRIIKLVPSSTVVAELAKVLAPKLIVVSEGAADKTLNEQEAIFCPDPKIEVPTATPAEPVIFPGWEISTGLKGTGRREENDNETG